MATDRRDDLVAVLQRRRAALLREAVAHEDAARGVGALVDSELVERAQDKQLEQMLARLDDRERREIADVEAALDRMADGTYGRCAGCAQTIEPARLAAMPEAALCIRCATVSEAAISSAPTSARPSHTRR